MQDGTLKVARIEDHKPQPVATHTVTYRLDGFEITSVIETAAPIRQIVDRLKAIGAEPPLLPAGKSEPAKQNGAPLCPTHNSPMKQGRRGWFCPKKTNGEYCRETA